MAMEGYLDHDLSGISSLLLARCHDTIGFLTLTARARHEGLPCGCIGDELPVEHPGSPSQRKFLALLEDDTHTTLMLGLISTSGR